MARGGYQKPRKPAPVSGPGRFSKRTDGKIDQPVRDLTGGDYGDGTEMQNLQASAPMSASARRPLPSAGPAPAPVAGGAPVPFDAPTQRPDEPVTAGVDTGPGPGSEVMPGPSGPDLHNLVSLLPVLNVIANGPNGTPQLRNLVRALKANA